MGHGCPWHGTAWQTCDCQHHGHTNGTMLEQWKGCQHILPMPMPGQANDGALGRILVPGHCEGQRGGPSTLGWSWALDLDDTGSVYEC